MTTYNINLCGDILEIGFGEPAQNDQIVKDAAARLEEMIAAGVLCGGREVIKVNGAASLPVAALIGEKLSALYAAVAFRDPKLGKYVVSIVHTNKYKLGDLLD